MDAARHKVVSCALRRGFAEHGRFHFGKALRVHILAYSFVELRTHTQNILKLFASQIEITVLQSQRFVCRFVSDGKRRRIRFGKYFKAVRNNFYVAGFHIFVYVVAHARPDDAADGDDILLTQGKSLVKQRLFGLR